MSKADLVFMQRGKPMPEATLTPKKPTAKKKPQAKKSK